MPADKPTGNPVTLVPLQRPLVETASDLLSFRNLLWIGLALAGGLAFAVMASHQRAPMPLPAAPAPASAGH